MVTLNVGLKLSAVVISMYCILMYRRNLKYHSRYASGFLFLCFNTLISSVLALLNALYDAGANEFYGDLRMAQEVAYAFFHDQIGFLFMLYFMQVFGSWTLKSKKKMFLLSLPLLFLETLIVTNPWFQLLFTIDHGEYVHGPLWALLLAIPGLYFLLSLVYIIYRRRVLPSNMFGLMFLGFFASIAGVLIQNVFGLFKIELFAESVCILMQFLTLNNVDRMIDYSTGVYNKKTLSDNLRRLTVMQEPFSLYDIRLISRDGASFPFLDESQKTELNREAAKNLLYEAHILRIFCFDAFHFVILMPHDEEKNVGFIRDLRTCLSSPLPVGSIEVQARPIVTRIRFPEDARTLDELNRYISKDNRTLGVRDQIDSPEENLNRMQRSTLVELAMHKALVEHRFTAALQPIYSLPDKKPAAMEAFLRLQDPIIGSVPPAEMIPIAEHNGSIQKIGLQVLSACCSIYVRYHLQECGIRQIHINLSNYQLIGDRVTENFLRVVGKYNLSPTLFSLEISNDGFLDQNPDVPANLERLSDAGFHLVLDNFGHTSTNIIHTLQSTAAGVKIDRKVLWGAIAQKERCMLLNTIIEALKADGKIVYQTGVETDEEEEFALESGCDFIQGYHFQRPMEEAELARFLSMQRKLREKEDTENSPLVKRTGAADSNAKGGDGYAAGV